MFRRLRHNDDGATDPILVIAAIAVSLILLVGGSFAVSGMISNAKDLNARDQLQKIAVAEAALQAGGGVTAAGAKPVGDGGLVFTGSGSYLNWKVTKDGTVTGDKTSSGKYLNEAGAVGFTPAEGVATEVVANDSGWVAGSLSQSGKQYWMSSTSSTIYNDTIPAGKYDPALTPPTLTAAYDATAECAPLTNGQGQLLSPDTDSVTMSKVNETTVRIAAVVTGAKVCKFAQGLELSLAGGSFASAGGFNDQYLRIGPPANMLIESAKVARVSLAAPNGYAITAKRNITIDVDIWPSSNFTDTDALVNAFNSQGGQVQINNRTIDGVFYYSYLWKTS